MRIIDLDNTATDFANDDYIALDGSVNGSRKMTKTTLLSKTSNNALANNVSEEFDPNKPNDAGGYSYYSGKNVTYEGKNYVFVVNHKSGAWDPTEVEQKPLAETIELSGVGEAVENWLDEHPEATTSVEDGSITEPKLADSLKLKVIKDYATPEMFGAKGDGVNDDTTAVQSAINSGKPVWLNEGKTYLVGPIDIDSAVVIYGNRAVLKQKDVDQAYVLKVNSQFNSIKNLSIAGQSTDYNELDSNNSAGIIFTIMGSKNVFELLFIYNFKYCIYSTGNSFWDNIFVRCQFNKSIYAVYAEHTALSIVFYTCSYNDAKTYFRINGGGVTCVACNFGNSNNTQLGIFDADCRSILFVNCNFEEATIKNYYIRSTISVGKIKFSGCYFHSLKMDDNPDARNGFLGLFSSAGVSGIIEFENCTFALNVLNTIIDYRTAGSEDLQVVFDWKSFMGIIGIVPSTTFVIGGIYSSNHPVIVLKEFVCKTLPDVNYFGNSNVKRFFKGTIAKVSEEVKPYYYDGSSWVDLQTLVSTP